MTAGLVGTAFSPNDEVAARGSRPPSARASRMAVTTVCLAASLALIAACGARAPGPVVPAAPTQAPVAVVDQPPAGSIWFGSSFDVSTFALSGRTTTIPLGSQVAFVAHLSRQSAGEVVGLALNIGGVDATWPGGQLAPGDEIMAQVLPAAEVFQAGPLVVRVVDAGGNTLASGTVTITP